MIAYQINLIICINSPLDLKCLRLEQWRYTPDWSKTVPCLQRNMNQIDNIEEPNGTEIDLNYMKIWIYIYICIVVNEQRDLDYSIKKGKNKNKIKNKNSSCSICLNMYSKLFRRNNQPWKYSFQAAETYYRSQTESSSDPSIKSSHRRSSSSPQAVENAAEEITYSDD